MILLRPILAVLFVAFALPAQADPIDLQVMNKVLVGRDQPSITLNINQDLAKGALDLRIAGRKPLSFSLPSMSSGTSKTFEFDLPPGDFSVEGQLSVVFADGTEGSMPLHFTILVAAPMSIEMPSHLIDFEKRQFVVRISRPAQHCDYRVHYENGMVASARSMFGGAAPGSDLVVRWGPPSGIADAVVIKIWVECFDIDYFSRGMEQVVWEFDIPHEEVLFGSGRWSVEPEEEVKIDAVLDDIRAHIERYRDVLSIGLYVTGHTDTVGSKQSNQTLSERRAASIAQYFQKQQLGVPVFYQGVGENQLAVQTNDEVSEARNRRMSYVLRDRNSAAGTWLKLVP